MASWHSPQPTRDPGPSPPGVGRRPQPLGGGGVGGVEADSSTPPEPPSSANTPCLHFYPTSPWGPSGAGCPGCGQKGFALSS